MADHEHRRWHWDSLGGIGKLLILIGVVIAVFALMGVFDEKYSQALTWAILAIGVGALVD